DNGGGLSATSEVVYAFTTTHADSVRKPATFLAAISNNGYASSAGTLAGTGLIADTTAVSLTASTDIGAYNGPRAGLTAAGYRAAIGALSNWQMEATSG